MKKNIIRGTRLISDLLIGSTVHVGIATIYEHGFLLLYSLFKTLMVKMVSSDEASVVYAVVPPGKELLINLFLHLLKMKTKHQLFYVSNHLIWFESALAPIYLRRMDTLDP